MASAKIVVEQLNPNLVTEVFEYILTVGNAPGAKGDTGAAGGVDYANPITANSTGIITPVDGAYYTSTSKLVTLTGSAGEIFEPAESSETSRIIWGLGAGAAITLTINTSSLGVGDIFAIEADNGESRIMMLNSAGDLVKIDGVVIPLTCQMQNNRTGTLPIANATLTILPLDITNNDPSGQMADPTTNKRVNIIRGGLYNISANLVWGDLSSTHALDHETSTRAFLNGASNPVSAPGYVHSAQNLGFGDFDATAQATLAPSDYLQLRAYHTTVGVSEALNIYGPTTKNILYVNEVAPW